MSEESVQAMAFSFFLPLESKTIAVFRMVWPPVKVVVSLAAVYPEIKSIPQFPLTFLCEARKCRLRINVPIRGAL
jgi:hypothetical protein